MTARWRLAIATAASIGLVVAVLAGCSRGTSSTATPPGEAPTETLAPFEVDDGDVVGGGGGGCADAGGSGGGSEPGPPAATGSPLAAPGARQLPGPSATVTSIPTSATSIVVQTPANPDEASPARQPDAVGTPTEPYVIGGATATTTDPADGGADPDDEDTTTTVDAAPTAGGCGGGL